MPGTRQDDDILTCCYAIARFFGPTLDHRVVTAFLGRQPSYAYLPGEYRNRLGQPQPNGMWQLTSEQQIVSDDLEEHIAWVLAQLEDATISIPEFMRSNGAQSDVYCYWETTANGGVSFSPSLLRRIADLGLSLGVTISYVDAPEE